MESFYEITKDKQVVGKMQITEQGLYKQFYCRCRQTDGDVYRIVACWKDGWKNIGILIPEGDGLILKKKLPSKHLGTDDLQFLMIRCDLEIEETLNWDFVQGKSVEQEVSIQKTDTDLVKTPDGEKSDEVYIPIVPDEPFQEMENLIQGKLAEQDGHLSVILENGKDQIEIERPMGQWSDPSISE